MNEQSYLLYYDIPYLVCRNACPTGSVQNPSTCTCSCATQCPSNQVNKFMKAGFACCNIQQNLIIFLALFISFFSKGNSLPNKDTVEKYPCSAFPQQLAIRELYCNTLLFILVLNHFTAKLPQKHYKISSLRIFFLSLEVVWS